MNNLLDICRLCMTKLCGVSINCLEGSQVHLCRSIEILYNLKITEKDKCSTSICPSCYAMILMSKVQYNKVIQAQFNINSALNLAEELSPLVSFQNARTKRGMKRRSSVLNECDNKKIKIIDATTNRSKSSNPLHPEVPKFMNSDHVTPRKSKWSVNTIWNNISQKNKFNRAVTHQRQAVNYNSIFDTDVSMTTEMPVSTGDSINVGFPEIKQIYLNQQQNAVRPNVSQKNSDSTNVKSVDNRDVKMKPVVKNADVNMDLPEKANSTYKLNGIWKQNNFTTPYFEDLSLNNRKILNYSSIFSPEVESFTPTALNQQKERNPSQKLNHIWNNIDLKSPHFCTGKFENSRESIDYAFIFDLYETNNMLREENKNSAPDINNRMTRHQLFKNQSYNQDFNNNDNLNNSSDKLYKKCINDSQQLFKIRIKDIAKHINRKIKKYKPSSLVMREHLLKIKELTEQMSQLKLDVFTKVPENVSVLL